MPRPKPRTPLLTAVFIAIAVVVALSFLGRRTGILLAPGGGGEAFRVADYVDMEPIPTSQAAGRIGERAVVCGRVAAATFAPSIGGEPTWLNFGAPHPNQDFDVVIWGRDRGAFPAPPEVTYRDQDVCAAGRITEHQDTPRISLRQATANQTLETESPPETPPAGPLLDGLYTPLDPASQT